MKVKIRRNDLFMENTCALCGEEFPPDIIVAAAYSDDRTKSYGEVCPKCIYQGPEQAGAAVRDQIKQLRERAERLLAVADDLGREISQPLELPTWPAWRKAHLVAFLTQINMVDDERIKAFRHTVREWADEALDQYLSQDVEAGDQPDPYQQACFAVAWHERELRQEKVNEY